MTMYGYNMTTTSIQAGGELRVIVKPENIDDLASGRRALDIAKNIEEIGCLMTRSK